MAKKLIIAAKKNGADIVNFKLKFEKLSIKTPRFKTADGKIVKKGLFSKVIKKWIDLIEDYRLKKFVKKIK